MCCDPSGADLNNLGEDETVVECPGCGDDVRYNSQWKEYTSSDICNYSPLCCDTCGCRSCDQSC